MSTIFWHISTMSMNIKNREAHDLARELSALTGESLTDAVKVALKERLERLRKPRGDALADHLLGIGKTCAAHLDANAKALDPASLLYDENGLPR